MSQQILQVDQAMLETTLDRMVRKSAAPPPPPRKQPLAHRLSAM